MSAKTIIALVLAFVSTTLINLAYLREHSAAAALPPLSLRRPLASLRLLLTDRGWLEGFAMETGGWLLYVVALALAPLALVQSIAAGGIGVLAFASARFGGRRLTRRERTGSALSVLGLLALSLSLVNGHAGDQRGSAASIVLWLAITSAVAVLVLTVGRRRIGLAAADGIAGGLLFSVGDIATKVATQGDARLLFAFPMIGGYLLGTSLLQLGYQRGAALTVAGIATLLTNALPIAAGPVLLDESIPGGVLGALRIIAFATVVGGAILLARPEQRPPPAAPVGATALPAAQPGEPLSSARANGS